MKAIEMRRWTRDEYDRMIAAGLFAPGERVELIDGEILQVAPQGSFHATAVQLAGDALRVAFGCGFHVRTQLPLAFDPASEPEPDVAVVPGVPRDYREAHPTNALLVVEIADATLVHDRQRKGSLYARAGIREYWIVNLVDRCVEVYRDPLQARYGSSRRCLPGDHITPLAAPESKISVADILP
jgi:Uma2 family endonuclease